MAEIMSSNSKKSNPRIDLTPMVDLGFLLITFFVFTANLNKPNTMDIFMPHEGGTPTEIPHHTAMTIFLGKEHQLFYLTSYDAMQNDFDKLTRTNFRNTGIRQALLQHTVSVKMAYAQHLKGSTSHDAPFILIKPDATSQYSDLIDLLDELAIANIHHYAIMDINHKESEAINKLL